MKMKLYSSLYDFLSTVVVSLLIVGLAFTFLFKMSVVIGTSMVPTLHNGDRLLITASDTEPAYGDIIVVSQPNSMEETLIKRVIATEGQTVAVDTVQGVVLVDGARLYWETDTYALEPIRVAGDMQYPLTVPEGYVFVMGDNRNNSVDSRDRRVGLIDKRYILGKALYRIGDRQLLETDLDLEKYHGRYN